MSAFRNDSKTLQGYQFPDHNYLDAKALMREFCTIQVCYPMIRDCLTLLVLNGFSKDCENCYAYSLNTRPAGFASIHVLSLTTLKFYCHVRREKLPNLYPALLV